jgi:hypothetical protein
MSFLLADLVTFLASRLRADGTDASRTLPCDEVICMPLLSLLSRIQLPGKGPKSHYNKYIPLPAEVKRNFHR